MNAVTFGRSMVRVAQRAVPRSTDGITVLAYHLIGAGTGSPVDLPAARFRKDMEWLAASGLAVSIDDAVDALERRTSMHRGVVVTFDDAFDNFREVAWPILSELEIPTTLYVPVGFLDGATPNPLQGAAHCSPVAWDDLRSLATHPLLTIGSHSYAHIDATSQTDVELRDDARRSKEHLESVIGQPVDHYCYPRALWSRRTRMALAPLFRTAAVAGGRVNRPDGFDPLCLQRLPLRQGMPPLSELAATSMWLEEAFSDLARRGRAYATSWR